MLKIRDRSKVPRELYDYTVPETQTHFEARSFGMCVAKVREGYIANKLPVPDKLPDLVESDWCSRYPHHCFDSEREIPAKQAEEAGSLEGFIASLAIPAADALSVIGKALGIDCTKCQRRHKIIKEMKKRGFGATLKLLKETLHA